MGKEKLLQLLLDIGSVNAVEDCPAKEKEKAIADKVDEAIKLLNKKD
jgi:hypothetical protein